MVIDRSVLSPTFFQKERKKRLQDQYVSILIYSDLYWLTRLEYVKSQSGGSHRVSEGTQVIGGETAFDVADSENPPPQHLSSNLSCPTFFSPIFASPLYLTSMSVR